MAVTAAYIKTLAPQFAGVADATINLWIGLVGREIDLAQFDEADRDYLTALWACHKLAMADAASGSAGPLTAYSVGGVSAQYAAPATLSGWHTLDRTSYGQDLLAAFRARFAGGLTSGGDSVEV
jgi:hypothetical protein